MDTDKLKNLTDAQRKELAEEMDRQLDEYIDNLESSSSKYMDGWNEETWEEEMQNHPFFANKYEEGQELSPLLKGIQDLKYSPDENSPEELAVNYKEDGNFNFKHKKYKFAIASYTEGLKHKGSDQLVNTQLLTNRAAAQFHLGNYRSSLMDCRMAVKLTPGHTKAILRGAQCCFKLKRFKECFEWCDKGLTLDSTDKTFLDIRSEATKLEKEEERNRRRQAAAEKKLKAEDAKVLETVRSRGIEIGSEGLEATAHPAAKRVRFNEQGRLVWPVLFMYPQFGETDFVEAFCEDDSFEQHIDAMFEERPPWDTEGEYEPRVLRLYYEDVSGDKLVAVRQEQTLNDVITDKRHRVRAGTPGFIVLVEGSKFQKEFMSKYK